MNKFRRIYRYFTILSLFIIGILTIVGSGGPSYVYRASSQLQKSKNDLFTANISAECNNYGCNSFLLSIYNNTDKDIELDWNKTLYISNGRTSGGFMFEGVVYKDRNNPKTPDIIFAKSSFSKSIYPNNLVEFTSGKYGGWYNERMPIGENGVYLTLKIGNEEIKEKLTLNITTEKVQ